MTDQIKISISFEKKHYSQITKEFIIDRLQDGEQKENLSKLMKGSVKALKLKDAIVLLKSILQSIIINVTVWADKTSSAPNMFSSI